MIKFKFYFSILNLLIKNAFLRSKLNIYKFDKKLISSIVWNQFLKDLKGVIHIGAHLGQERELYDYYDL